MIILLDSIDKVKNFVAKVSFYPCEIDLVSGRYTIDAKSIMGIFSLDLAKPITVKVLDEKYADKIAEDLKEFAVSD